jgi:hypothetical protein
MARFNDPIEPMTLGNMRANGVSSLARCVMLAVPPPGDHQRSSMAGRRAGADVRAADGVYEVRDHRRRRPAELGGEAGAREPDRRTMAMIPRKRGIGPDQRRVLQLLARSTNGHTEAMLLAHGFTTAMLTVLVRDGLATATPETVRAGKRPIRVVRVRITDAGRQALAE